MRPYSIYIFLLLLPLSFCSISPECSSKIKQTCREELREMGDTASKLTTSLFFPPLSAALAEYDNLLQSALNCESTVECAHGQSMEEMFESFRTKKIAEQNYLFDSLCLDEVMFQVQNGEHFCARDYDFMTRDPSNKPKVFAAGKSCFLKIANATCDFKYYDFLEKNYEDIMGMYTSRPNPDNGLCNSAFDKFHDVQCSPLKENLNSVANGSLVDVTDSQMQDTIMACRQYQYCLEESCLYAEERKELGPYFIEFKAVCDGIEDFVKVLKKDFFGRPSVRGMKCVKDLAFLETAQRFASCKIRKSGENCWATILKHGDSCKMEIAEMMVEKKFISLEECPTC